MAMKIVYTCDSCGKEATTHKCALYTDYLCDHMVPFCGFGETSPTESEAKVDLCETCMSAILLGMRGVRDECK